MRTFAFILVFFSFLGISSAQTKYDKIDLYDLYQKNWAMVEIDGKKGFID